jgi:ferritin-like metal-binding protein YciE
MKMQSIQDLLFTGLTYTYDLEKQTQQALPKSAEAASNGELKQQFQNGVQESETNAQRLEQVFQLIGKQVDSNTNQIARAMNEEVSNMISNTDASPVRDAALIVAGNQMTHYKMANYGSLRTYAELLGNQQAVSLLQQTLDDVKQADERLTAIATNQVNKQAASASAGASA